MDAERQHSDQKQEMRPSIWRWLNPAAGGVAALLHVAGNPRFAAYVSVRH